MLCSCLTSLAFTAMGLFEVTRLSLSLAGPSLLTSQASTTLVLHELAQVTRARVLSVWFMGDSTCNSWKGCYGETRRCCVSL